MRIEITEEHVRRGQPGTRSGCPVALGVAQVLPGALVTIYRINYVTPAGRKLSANLPRDVTKRLMNYDRTGVMAPFAFDLKM